MMTSRKVAGANYVCGVVAFDRLLIFIQRRTSTLLIALWTFLCSERVDSQTANHGHLFTCTDQSPGLEILM